MNDELTDTELHTAKRLGHDNACVRSSILHRFGRVRKMLLGLGEGPRRLARAVAQQYFRAESLRFADRYLIVEGFVLVLLDAATVEAFLEEADEVARTTSLYLTVEVCHIAVVEEYPGAKDVQGQMVARSSVGRFGLLVKIP